MDTIDFVHFTVHFRIPEELKMAGCDGYSCGWYLSQVHSDRTAAVWPGGQPAGACVESAGVLPGTVGPHTR